MPEQLTRADFAASVKAKYPQYAQVPDDQLVSRMLEKFPVYRDRIKPDTPPQPAKPVSLMDVSPTLRTVRDVAGGLRASAAQTVYGGGDLIRRGWNAVVPERFEAERVIDRPEVRAAMTPPASVAGTVGYLGGEAAQFAVPLTKVTRAVKGSRLLTRIGAEAAASAGVAGVQSAGDPTEMGIAAAGGALLPAVVGTARMAQRAAAGAREGGVGGAVASAVRTVAPGEPRTLLVQALKPTSTKIRFPSSLDRALPEIKAAEAVIGKPIASIDDLLTATTAAKKRVYQQLGQVRGTAQGFEVDLSPVADAMERSIPTKLRLERPGVAQQLGEAANVYRRPFSLDDAEQLLKETNAELEGLYAKYPGSMRKAVTSDPEWARLDSQGKALREAIDTTLDRAAEGGGAAAKELRRRYGALLDVESESFRRVNVAKRQQPESLSEQLSAARAAGDIAKGAWRLMRGDVTGAADIASGVAMRDTAKYLKEQQTTDALIRRAFAGYKGKPAQIVMPQARPVRGLLPAASRRTGPVPDPSFVRGVPAISDVQYSGKPRQLPPGRTVRPMDDVRGKRR